MTTALPASGEAVSPRARATSEQQIQQVVVRQIHEQGEAARPPHRQPVSCLAKNRSMSRSFSSSLMATAPLELAERTLVEQVVVHGDWWCRPQNGATDHEFFDSASIAFVG